MSVTFLTNEDRTELEGLIEELKNNSPDGTVTDEQIADAVEDYFTEHPIEGKSGVYTLAEGETIADAPADADVVIDPYADPEIPEGGNGTDCVVELDTTLSESGKAADAKAVGDAFDFTTIAVGNNLLDISKVTPNKNIHPSTGAIIDSSNNSITDYIYVPGGTTISFFSMYGAYTPKQVNFARICSYDATDTVVDVAVNVPAYTLPKTAVKFRASMSKAHLLESSNSMIVKGTPTEVEYEPYREQKVSGIKVLSANVLGSERWEEGVQKSRYYFRKVDAVCDRYSNGVDKIPNIWHGSGTPVSSVYDLYDALVNAHPDYVTKTQIGTTDDDDVLPIYRYDFTPKIPQDSQTKLCKIMYCSGTHGGEISSIIVGAQFFKDLCENWRTQDLLRTLRFNCHFIVIPLVNPYGFVHNTKQNENGVNLNRNFTNGWVLVEDELDYSGNAAASETITKTIEQIISDEKPDFGLDHHIYNSFTGSGKAGYLVGCVKRPADVSCSDMLGVWANSKVMRDNTLVNDFSKNHYQLLNRQTDFGGYLYGAFPNGFCFETMTGWGDDEMEAVYDSQKFNAEVLGGIFYSAFVGYHTY